MIDAKNDKEEESFYCGAPAAEDSRVSGVDLPDCRFGRSASTTNRKKVLNVHGNLAGSTNREPQDRFHVFNY